MKRTSTILYLRFTGRVQTNPTDRACR